MTKVKFLKDVTIRGQSYKPGQAADIDDDHAAKLSRSGGIEPLPGLTGSRANPAMRQVRFLRPTKVDGRNHGAGAYVELEERKAEALRAADVVVFPGESGWTGDTTRRNGPGRRENASINGKG
ncbi:hypothetical protein SAMN05444166_1868 [Singulisphaera sp. GP187]|uniref:hypothetical protein n=1 Tax=Singulisphaera sp. GP187 TaxID=1882752 RepID=UPI0009260759|nr:hypothetical protein [Singulisphaera sp. GP187]SIN97587.1 hypothetical protein SAMN05444166_1868 [Singulisphaera sp. GP187]